MRLILSGERLNAQRALELGIVQDIYPNSELHAAQIKLARKIAKHSQYALALAKQATQFSFENGSISREYERKLFQSSLELPGAKEGLNAFNNKRKPDFTGI